MVKYDYLIVGSGLFGSLFAYEANKRGKRVLVIEKRPYVGGNMYCKKIEGINVHWHGPHIFHTSDKDIWDYINQFTKFNNFMNSPIASYENKIFNLPFNMNTFYQLWGTRTPDEAKRMISKQINLVYKENPMNLEEQAKNLVGNDIYTKLIEGYTQKQWGRKCRDLPAFIIKRIPLRYTYDNNYFNDIYQGVAKGGYNEIFDKLLENIKVLTNKDYFDDRDYFDVLADKIVFTGRIDQFYNYKYGVLEYRGLRFEHEIIENINFQGNAVVNYTESTIPYTRIVEHKHFEFGTQNKTIITKEYPVECGLDDEPYYPINDERNSVIFNKYLELAKMDKTIFGGRLADYKYYDMNHIIEKVLKLVKDEFGD